MRRYSNYSCNTKSNYEIWKDEAYEWRKEIESDPVKMAKMIAEYAKISAVGWNGKKAKSVTEICALVCAQVLLKSAKVKDRVSETEKYNWAAVEDWENMVEDMFDWIFETGEFDAPKEPKYENIPEYYKEKENL